MTNATMELYNALREAGVPEDRAEAAAKSVMSREEAREQLVTKVEFYKGLMVQATFIITVLGVLIALF